MDENERLDHYFNEVGIPPLFRKARISDFDQFKDSKITGKDSFLISGPVSTGKTHFLAALVHDLFKSRLFFKSCFFKNVPGMLRLIKTGFEKHEASKIEEELRLCDFLFLDDLGTEKDSEWTNEFLYSLINHRYEYEKHLCVTTNLDMTQLAARYDSRIVRRLMDMCSVRMF